MNKLQVEGTRRTRGMLKLIWVEVVWKDMAVCDLMIDMILNRVEWKNRIRVTHPK